MKRPLGHLVVGVQPLESRLQQRVAESQHRSGDFILKRSRAVRIIALKVARRLKRHLKAVHQLHAHQSGKKLPIGDLLNDGAHDLSGGLKEALISPVIVHHRQLLGDAIVLAQKDGVQGGQSGLLTGAKIAGDKTKTRRGLALGMGGRLWQQVLHSPHWMAGKVELAHDAKAQSLRLTVLIAVDVGAVDVGGQLVHLLARPQRALGVHGADKVQTPRQLSSVGQLTEEGVVRGDGNWPALRVDGLAGVAALAVQQVTIVRQVGGREGDVVVEKLWRRLRGSKFS